jgi:hypothetical protein
VTQGALLLPTVGGPRYRRRMEAQLTPLENGQCEAIARLEFYYPDGADSRVYELTMRIDQTSGTILEARVPIFFAENDACAVTAGLVEQLVGLNVVEKFTWRIHRLFGNNGGCKHLLELSEEIGRAWFNRMATVAQQRMDKSYLEIVEDHCAGLRHFAAQARQGEAT